LKIEMRGQSDNQLPDYPIIQLPDSRALGAIGRAARLELVFERRGDRTVIAHAYAEPPFRVGHAFAIGDAAYVILVCAGPGIFGGDALHQSIRVEPGACAVLTSQSALQVHPGAASKRAAETAAVVHHTYRVAEDAELHCHWDPVIPFACAALDQQFDLALHASSRLYWSDALMSGRARHGEAWRFRALAHTLRLRVDGSLKYLERYRLRPVLSDTLILRPFDKLRVVPSNVEGRQTQDERGVEGPADRSLTSRWIADDANYFATMLVHHPRAAHMQREAQMEREALAERSGAHLEVDLLEPNLMVGRVMACNGVSFASARADMRRAVLASVFQNPMLAGRK
jgi:urease accessory protein UreH